MKKPKGLPPTPETIEGLVRARRSVLARIAISAWLRTQPGSLNAKIRASDWFRRLGFYREAYRLIAPRVWHLRKAAANPAIAEHYLWVARYLNLMGATDYAFQIVRYLKPRQPEQLRILGALYLVADEYERAHSLYTQAWEKASAVERKTYSARIGLLSLCDALCGLERRREAITLARSIEIAEGETLLRGIVTQALGEYLARDGRFTSARRLLQKSLRDFSTDDLSADRGVLLKWLAYVEARCGNIAEGKSIFEESLKILMQPGMRAEGWLECLELMWETRLLSPERQALLFGYPGVSGAFRLRPTHPRGLSIIGSTPEIILFPERDEWRKGVQSYWGMTKELRLLAILRSAGELGIFIDRIKPLLWPDELDSFLQLDSRLSLLLNRLKKLYGVITQVSDRNVRIVDGTGDRIAVEVLSHRALPSFFESMREEGREFTSREFCAFYALKPTAGTQALSDQVVAGVLEIRGSARLTRYRVRP